MRPLIIERPDLQTAVQRYGYVSLTLFCWFLWLYLFVPLVSLGAWAFGGALVYERLLSNLDNPLLLARLGHYLTFIAAFSAAYLGWAVYNYLRWRGVERRKATQPVSVSDLSHRFHLSERRIRQLQIAPSAIVTTAELEQLLDPTTEDLSALLEDPPEHLDDKAA
ncbi:MAG TPA: poly-beta-1,6-N-acetyl-D-glucosamine biosynthesis protein PgaD [Pseudomonadales bacterium]